METKAKVIYRKLSEIKELEKNPRYIKDDQFNKLCVSIQRNPDYFEARPIILSDRTGELVIIAGNQRYRAASHLKLEQVPTILLSGLDEEREKEIIIRDNINNGAWDWDTLANENWNLEDLADWGLSVDFLTPGDESTDIDDLFEDADNSKAKEKPIEIKIEIPNTMEEQLDEIKGVIEVALADYPDAKIK